MPHASEGDVLDPGRRVEKQATQIVLLNGVGSAGKSSIARALQGITRDPFLHIEMDAFLEMLPANSFDTPQGLTFRASTVEGRTVVDIETGELAALALHGMRRAIGAMADAGLNLIVDDVAGAADIGEYRTLLRDHRLWVVGVMASLPTLEAREQERGDRAIGLARGQFPAVHQGIDYDVVIDTDTLSAEQCAARLAANLGL